ncbi:MAG: DUF4179 domain-containing protein [Ignavibacteriales bacterium]
MSDIESMLEDRRIELEQIEVPVELEHRLRSALDKRSGPVEPRFSWGVLVAGIVLAFMVIYNFDAVAYYGKKLVGYDEVMNGTLQQLNELGKGQIVNKSCTLPSGVIVTLDGIMLDANQLIVFCSVRNPHGQVDNMHLGTGPFMNGTFGSYLINGGQGELSDDKSEEKWTFNCDTPFILERNLDFDFNVENEGRTESGTISFRLDRSKAMGRTLKKTLNKTIKLGNEKITLESITASPTSTVVKGSMRSIVELAADQIMGERMRPNELTMELIANGKIVTEMSGGMSTDMNGIRFHQENDALPSGLKQLQIKIVSFGADHDVKERVALDQNKVDVPVEILNQDITINKVFETNGDLFVTVTSEESVIFTRVNAVMDNRRVSLLETIDERLDKKIDGTITRTRTLHFKGLGDDLVLDIQRMSYRTTFNKIVDVPVN